MAQKRYHVANFRFEMGGLEVGRFETLLTAPAPGMTPQPVGPHQIALLATRPALPAGASPPRHFNGISSRVSQGERELWLKHGTCSALALQRWKNAALPSDVVLVALNSTGGPIARYSLTRAWPAKWHGSPSAANGGDIAIEDIVIMYEGIQPA